MSDYSRNLVLAVVLLMAVSGGAYAERIEPAPPPQQNWFLRWLSSAPAPLVASRPAANKLSDKTTMVRAVRPGSASVVEKPQPSCAVFTCVLMVGIAF
jgi:hypothetical protein